ncbi:MAG: NRAMP family divalent metal transporter [Janthinobacterium lividum]
MAKSAGGTKGAWALLAVMGPGLLVMLADTDVGSLVTAAQSGAQWGYSLVGLQLALIPVLFVVQLLTSRLGSGTGKGHGALILEHFGRFWAWVSFAGLVVAGIGALMTEFSGLAGVGDLFGLSRWLSLGVPALLLLVVVWTGSYRRVERIAIVVGLFELSFLYVAWRAHPGLADVASGMTHIPLAKAGFLTLVAANIGAVVMPWMIFYQQSATADKGLREDDQPSALWDTLIGAVVSQVVMSAVLIATAATIGHGAGTKNGGGGHASLNTVGDVANAFIPALGPVAGKLVFAGGIVAAALVSAIVVSLALAWSFGDIMERKSSLEDSPRDAPAFYAAFTFAVVAGAVAVQFVDNLVALNITVEVLNALLLPLALGLLVLLSERALPERTRLRGWFRAVVYAVTALTLLAATVGVLDSIGLI